jgi:hypothetical protein
VSLPSIELREPYRPRTATFLELWQPNDWLVKLYGLAYERETPDPATVTAAKHAATTALPHPARTNDRYGIAIVIVHQGQDACWLLIDWWGHESVLHHRLLMAPLGKDDGYRDPPPDVAACVWELPLLMFERDAWVTTVMSGGSIADYLSRRYAGPV